MHFLNVVQINGQSLGAVQHAALTRECANSQATVLQITRLDSGVEHGVRTFPNQPHTVERTCSTCPRYYLLDMRCMGAGIATTGSRHDIGHKYCKSEFSCGSYRETQRKNPPMYCQERNRKASDKHRLNDVKTVHGSVPFVSFESGGQCHVQKLRCQACPSCRWSRRTIGQSPRKCCIWLGWVISGTTFCSGGNQRKRKKATRDARKNRRAREAATKPFGSPRSTAVAVVVKN